LYIKILSKPSTRESTELVQCVKAVKYMKLMTFTMAWQRPIRHINGRDRGSVSTSHHLLWIMCWLHRDKNNSSIILSHRSAIVRLSVTTQALQLDPQEPYTGQSPY